MKGIIFSLDAVLGLILLVTFMSTFVVILQMNDSSPEDMLILTRIARDVVEIKLENPWVHENYLLPDGFSYDCTGKENIGSALYFEYNGVDLDKKTVEVCYE